MPKPYDDAMKKLVGGNPQDLISWVLPGAQFGKQLPFELNVENIYADGLLLATLDGHEFLAHFEFQSSNDVYIGERLLEYNVLASRQYNYLPVYSCVIYLKNHGNVPHSPFLRGLPNGEEVVRFHYRSIELGKLAAGELLQTGLVGLLPLLPLTKDGARREVVEEMISGLVSAEKPESLWIGYALASKVLKDDLKWLRRRFAMLEDILRDTPVYQEVLAEGVEKGLEQGLEKGLEKGLEQGIKEGELRAQRQTLLDIVQERFPAIARLAKQQADAIEDPEVLRRLTVKISIVRTSKEAEQFLLNPSSAENRH
jgi:predicted transposase YdaD